MLLVTCLALMLAACDSPKLNPINHQDVIVAFGDSLTEGVGTHKEHSYPNKLAELSGVNVINAGVSGETTSEGLNRLTKVIDEHNPKLLILLEGGNDILQNINDQQIEQNLESMIQIALARDIQVILVGVPKKSLFSSSAPFYSALAKKYNLVFDSTLVSNLLRNPSMKSDPIHFNTKGYGEMANEIYALLSDNGAFN